MFARIALRTARMSRLSSPYACRSGFHTTGGSAVRNFAIGHRPPLRKPRAAEARDREAAKAASPERHGALQTYALTLRARSRRLSGETTLAFG